MKFIQLLLSIEVIQNPSFIVLQADLFIWFFYDTTRLEDKLSLVYVSNLLVYI